MYLLTSLFFVVAAFVEFAFVLHLHHQNERHMQSQKPSVHKCDGCSNGKTTSEQNVNNDRSNEKTNSFRLKYDIKKIDVVAFIVGAVFYVVFNIIYWVVFLNFDFE